MSSLPPINAGWPMSTVAIAHATPDVAKIIIYEFAIFEYLYGALKTGLEESEGGIPSKIELAGTGHTNEDQMNLSAQLESYLLHARVLRDFFHYYEMFPQFNPSLGAKQDRRNRDDVLAQDFIPDWGKRGPKIGSYLFDNKKRLDKSLAHLSTQRVEYKTNEKRWDIASVRNELLPVIEKFKADLPADRRQWFGLE